ncbi:MAG: hypothetical protein QM790_07035 [Nibricoccus sp.]
MKKAAALVILYVSSLAGVFADTYFGTITQTITKTNDPQFFVGQTFVGCYAYDSTSINGYYCAPSHWYPTTPTNLSLSGTLYVPFADEAHFEWTPSGQTTPISYTLAFGDKGSYQAFTDTPINPGKLMIENGCVTGFSWSFDVGGFFMEASENSFQAYSYYDRGPADQTPKTSGTITIGNPTRVPDTAATLSLLAAGLLGLGLFRRRYAS